MDEKNANNKKVEEPAIDYKSTKPQQGSGKNLNFDERFKKGLTSEEFLAEMKKRIRKYPWKK